MKTWSCTKGYVHDVKSRGESYACLVFSLSLQGGRPVEGEMGESRRNEKGKEQKGINICMSLVHVPF